jgi:hypothetical protein
MRPLRSTLAVPFICLVSLAGSCSHPFTGLPVRIADVGRCSGQRDIILKVMRGGGLKLNSEDQKREELGRRLAGIFRTRVERYVFITGDPNASFDDVAEVIDIASREVDYVALVTPSVMARATYQGGDCLPHDRSKDTCLDPRLPVGHIKHSPK